MYITFHREIKRASDAFKFPINGLNSTIKAALNEYKEKYNLLMLNTYVHIKYNYEYLFIYMKDVNNIQHRIDVQL